MSDYGYEVDATADELAELLDVDPEKIMTEPKHNRVSLTNAQARRLIALAKRVMPVHNTVVVIQ